MSSITDDDIKLLRMRMLSAWSADADVCQTMEKLIAEYEAAKGMQCFHYVDVAGKEYQGALNLFVDDYPVALVTVPSVANKIRKAITPLPINP